MATDVVNRQLENVPVGVLIRKLGESIAEAQIAMDRLAIQSLRAMADRGESGVTLPGSSETRSMLELGFLPTFYHFNGATLEAFVAFSVTESSEVTVGGSLGVNIGLISATINASYTSKYSFSASATSSVRATIVSVPPPAPLNDFIQRSINKSPAT